MVANNIRRMREARSMEATELAWRIGRSTTTLWRYETGDAQPPLPTARKIASVLGTTLDELFPIEQQEAAA
jgi:DNA-binding XRE family transcriptional regulator